MSTAVHEYKRETDTQYVDSTRTPNALTVDQDFGLLSADKIDPFGVDLVGKQDLMEPLGRVEEVDLGGLT